MKEINKIKFFVYCRKSSEDTQRQVASIDDQLNALQKMVDSEELTVACVFTEEKSSKMPGRPVFDDMVARIKKGEANGILCWDIDRLSRNPLDSSQISWALQLGMLKAIVTPSRIYFPEDAGLLLSIEQGRATDFVIRLSKNVKRGLHGKAMRGWRPSGSAIGYMNLGTEKGNKTIGIDPERFPIVRRIWDLYLTGHYSVRELNVLANEQWGLRTPQKRKLGGRKLAMSQMYAIFNSPFYMGKFPWKDPETGEVGLYQGVHQPMITEQEFERGQILLGAKAQYRPHGREFAYTGLAYCGECNSAITAEEKNQIICTGCKHKFGYENKKSCPKCHLAIDKMHNPSRLNYVYYRCTKRKNLKCTQKYIRLEQFEEQLAEVLDEITIDDGYVTVALDYLKDTENLEVQDNKTIIGSLQEARKQCDDRLERLNMEYTSPQNLDHSIYSSDEFVRFKKAIIKERESIDSEIIATRQRIDDSFEKAERVFNFCTMVKKKFREGDLKTKRMILTAIGSNITLMDKKLSIQLIHPFTLVQNELAQQTALKSTFEHEKAPQNVGPSHFIGSEDPQIICMLDIAREIGTFWKENKAHIWLPNIKQGFFGIVRPTDKEMAEFYSR